VKPRARVAATLGVLAALTGSVGPLSAQLISPGKLSRAHAGLTGITQCTACHELGSRGSSDARCLACHTPLQEQIREGRGLHAGYAEPSCATCHKEHFGESFDVLRFDSLSFDHASTGFELTGSHAALECRACHTRALIQSRTVAAFLDEHRASDRTFLGMGTSCVACHLGDDPHRSQFGEASCSDCHDEGAWTPAARFDHDEIRYPLTGRHRQVECTACHAPSFDPGGGSWIRYAPTGFGSCLACHDDDHQGAMGASCRDCHSTRSWTEVSRSFEGGFDHARTGFELLGAHAGAACASCHGSAGQRPADVAIAFAAGNRSASYPRPLVEGEGDCLACHVDEHDGAFTESPAGGLCSACHTELAWVPNTFDFTRHEQETSFPLTGAHLATPCVTCHENRALGHDTPTYAFADASCRACHTADDPHAGQFAEGCEACHTTDSFRIPDFDHEATRFPLEGRHREAPCNACHVSDGAGDAAFVRYLPVAMECTDCHGGD